MNPAQRIQLTKALSAHVAAIAADLRAQMLAEGPVRARAKKLHAEEQVGDDFDVWTDLLSRRAAVLWVLKTVYVRVLEDRGLVRPGRLLDAETQQLFEKLAPNLGETAFLTWVFRDLASPRGGLPELFAPQPAEVAVPADARSRALLELWRAKDADTGFQWSFAGEAFAGELMGDLYQELDPVVKDRYALCQTPDFVRDFMLGQTLTPAIAELGADAVRLLDPACGSGHFLLDALRRLVDATAAQHADWPRRQVVEHALDRVVGIDLNDYACALARARLVMTAAELAGATSLAEAASFHPHVYWADGLEQVERDDDQLAEQLDLLSPGTQAPPRAVLTRPFIRTVLRQVLKPKFQVVVGNPPYITERDPERKEYHREKVGRQRRYVSAYREYSLAAPFIERSFQLAAPGARMGLIVGNGFMRREFGKPLIEQVLTAVELKMVIDSSQAFIPHHGTPTVILFARNCPPNERPVRVVMAKRGETDNPDDPRQGKVWKSILEGYTSDTFENDYISTADVPRAVLGVHPWSLGGGGVAELKTKLEARATKTLAEISDIGVVGMTRADDIYVGDRSMFLRARIPAAFLRSFALGNRLRDWSTNEVDSAIFPYDANLEPVTEADAPAVHRFLWRYRSHLWERREPNGNHREIGLTWWEWSRLIRRRLRSPLSIALAKISTHNQFVLGRGEVVFSDGTPVVKLPADSSEEEHLTLLGLLNSSLICFWMKQMFQPKGGDSTGTRKQSETWARRIDIDTTKLGRLPIVDPHSSEVTRLALQLDALGSEHARLHPRQVFARGWVEGALAQGLRESAAARTQIRHRMIALQEKLDWSSYVTYGLLPPETISRDDDWPTELESGLRPFAIHMARKVASGSLRTHWFDAHGTQTSITVPSAWPDATIKLWSRLLEITENNPEIALIEQPDFKRKWEPTDANSETKSACWEWISERIELAVQARATPASVHHLVATIQNDVQLLEAGELLQERSDFELRKLVAHVLTQSSVPNHPWHLYTDVGNDKRLTWEEAWRLQRLEDSRGSVESIPLPPPYSQGSRGKSVDFIRSEYWKLRGALDVPKERFIAFTEVPGRGAGETLYGWAGWTPTERVKAILAMDEECEDQGIALADRVALLDSAWRLIPDVIRDDATTGARLKAELQALLGADGPSKLLLDEWKKKFPPPGGRGKGKKAAAPPPPEDDED